MPAKSESKVDDGQFRASLKPSGADSDHAERLHHRTQTYNDRQEELVRRALDGKRWRKALECAGAIRGDPERQKALVAACVEAELVARAKG